MFEFFKQYQDLGNSPFAFPRLPPRANFPGGVSMAGKLKENIINDNSLMMGRLTDFYSMFQKYAAGLFDLSPTQFGPGHPINATTNSINTIQDENERLKKENAILKKEIEKQKQK